MDDLQKHHLRDNLRAAYDKYASDRDARGMQEWKIRERSIFLTRLKQEHKQTLLEIGAGPGRDGKYFQDQGFEIVCTDLSPAMVELCRQKGLTAYVMDIGDLQFPDGSFDGVYSMNSLLHLPKVEFPGVLRRIDRLLKPQGVVYIGMYGGFDFEGIWEKEGYEPQRYYSFFTDERLEQEVTNVLDIHSFTRISLDAEDPLHFQSLILKKKPSA
jgi:SAM-dependent methyltransferase